MPAAWYGHSLLLDNTYSVQALTLHCMPVLQTTAYFELNTVPALKRALKLLQPSLQSKVYTLKVQSAVPQELLITAQHCTKRDSYSVLAACCNQLFCRVTLMR